MTRLTATTALAAMLAATGCAHRVPRGGETITYQVTRCHGFCPAYTVTLGPDGQGIFAGEANAAHGDHRFAATPDQVRAFTAALARVRPDRERLVERGYRDCEPYATDQSSIDVTWQGAGGAAHFRLDLGCHGKRAQALAAQLRGLPITHLPLQPFLGPD